ncbi:glycosyltransferase family 2 protein [Tenacibaculum sp. IB213877]|uniref:glycosyltransferase family 2 protein n=1 Tax=Tenacibaculum sp. IB213877 TaxID=3097351 RepID=UPI002A5992B4|nr:glycosyltransferase family 2 protein [Tenacibaculum sp. IB213877]MDY0779629.1 glycosyltransferase family 2 protein [Tenacibaculum sp. IB213877]
MTKITAIIPTFNEEDNIQRALNSVSFADEIIVIDSFSTDKTSKIVRDNKVVKLLQRKFDDFSSQKNFAIQQATYNWIFLLDADEEVEEELRKEILSIVNNAEDKSAYNINRNFYFKSKKINFGGFQRSKVTRLFKKEFCFYKGKVHEQLEVKGNVGLLKNKLNHYSYKSYAHYKNKLTNYAKLQAEELLAKKQIVTPYHLYIKPLVRFFIHYFIRFGFLDGKKGLVLAYVHGYGVKRRYIELKLFKN